MITLFHFPEGIILIASNRSIYMLQRVSSVLPEKKLPCTFAAALQKLISIRKECETSCASAVLDFLFLFQEEFSSLENLKVEKRESGENSS